MGAEKPQDLQCATWGPRKVGVIQFVSKDLRIRNSDGISSCPSTTEEIRLAPSVKKGEKKKKLLRGIFPSSAFCSFQALSLLGDLTGTHTGEGILLYRVHPIQGLISSRNLNRHTQNQSWICISRCSKMQNDDGDDYSISVKLLLQYFVWQQWGRVSLLCLLFLKVPSNVKIEPFLSSF